jgi:hypothetical protein
LESPSKWLKFPRNDLLVIGGYTLLTLIFTWPLIAHPNTHVLGIVGDNYEYVWKMWWVPHALFDRHISPFVQPDLYYPYGYALALGEITPVNTFFLMPLTLLLGEVTTYNLAILASCVLSGWITYRLMGRWLQRLDAEIDDRIRVICAFYAGAAFTFSAYRLVRLGGHLPLVGTQWLVLAVLGLDRWLENRRLPDAAIMALGITLASLSSWYYAYMLVLLLPVYVIAYGGLPALIRDRRTWLGVGLAGVIVAALCVPFMLPYLQLNTTGQTFVPLDDAAFWAASPVDYLIPNPTHPLWSRFAQRLIWPFGPDAPLEFAATVGWLTLLFGVWGWGRLRQPHWRAIKWVIGAAFILSLGPFLSISRLPTRIPLPVLALRTLTPIASSVRSWGRFSVMVMLGMSLLAGAGLSLWAASIKSARGRIAGAVSVLAVSLFAAWGGVMELNPVEPRPVDLWLADQPGQAIIMQYPVDEALSGPSMLYSRYHGQRTIYGYGTYFPFRFREDHPELLDFPSDAAISALQDWGVRYILVNTGADFDLEALDRHPQLDHVVTLGDQAVFELVEK